MKDFFTETAKKLLMLEYRVEQLELLMKQEFDIEILLSKENLEKEIDQALKEVEDENN